MPGVLDAASAAAERSDDVRRTLLVAVITIYVAASVTFIVGAIALRATHHDEACICLGKRSP